MATRTTPFAPGTPCWVDLYTRDPDQAKQFYAAVLGWAFEDSGEEYGGYIMVRSGGHQVAGMMANTEGDQPDGWTTYLATDDIHAHVAAAAEAGAQVIVPAMEVAGLGHMAVLVDPAGGGVGLWQAGGHIGFEKYNEPGSVTWDEHNSKHIAASQDFYARVFGYTYEKVPMDEMAYWMVKVDGQDVAGMGDMAEVLPPEVPTHWAVYFGVEDADEALARATERGGTVVMSPVDTEFGRIAQLLDPTGVPFMLHSDKLANPGPEPAEGAGAPR